MVAQGYQRKLLTGCAQWFADASLGTWKSDGSAYGAGDTGIVLRTITQAPDRLIVLSTYSVDDDPALSDTVTGLQVVTRWGGSDPRFTDDLTDAVYDLVHGAHDFDLTTGIHVVEALLQSGITLGQDANNRWRTSSNYYLTTHRPSPNRT